MQVRDKARKVMVNVLEPACMKRACYWPRTNPGVFVQGRGYRGATNDWLCGTRQVRGCPDDKDKPAP